ncbi:MAG: class I SAM-dependent methyltransferase [Oscillospiraceae bacterium]|nr:class I SAM-dependent methyltransferase [Oscillospiraceae bacterium]
MDLHDYKDVAENYDAYLSVMYSEHDNYEGFRDFYLDLAREYGNKGTIDIACGTGAVLLHLAQAGIDVDGTDLSEAMCDVAHKKAISMGLSPRIFAANMTDFQSDRKYSLAIIARSGFMHLLTPELQRKALNNIRENLTDGGVLTLNTFAPYPIYQAEQMKTTEDDYSFRLEYTNIEGQRERIYDAITYDPKTQLMYGNWKFETLDENGHTIAKRIRPLKMRQTYKQEMLYLIELCGFEVIDIYGDYHKNKDAAGSSLIWLLKKAR